MKTKLIIFCTLISLYLQGQVNLVPNPGFEDYTYCPVNYTGSINELPALLGNWYCPTDATSDYLNACSTAGMVGVPQNSFGYRAAHSGNGYAGMFMCQTGRADDYAEYLQTRLTEKLVAGEYYCVSFYVSISADNSYKYSTSAIGALLSVLPKTNYNAPYGTAWKLPFTPSVANPANNYILPGSGWVKVSGLYQAAGGEEYLTIGNYKYFGDTPVNQVSNTGTTNDIYFFIDDVSVLKMNTLKDDTVVCVSALPALQLSAGGSSATYQWSTGETTRTITPADSGWYWVAYDPGCGSTLRDSAHVTITDVPLFTLPADTFFCAGTPLQLSASVAANRSANYYWNTGHFSPSVFINNSGTYILQATNSCGMLTDTVVVAMYDKQNVQLPATIDICVNEQVQPVTISNSVLLPNYVWSTGDTTENITIEQPGRYWLASKNSCGVTRRIFTVEGCPPPVATIYIPNAFSPNGDGNNDIWMVYTDSVKVTSIEVYDRWGEKVFESTANGGCDGHYKGALQPAGVYVYYMRCSDMVTTEPRHYKGSLALLR